MHPGSASAATGPPVQFLLENSVFLLIGLQVRSIINAANADPLGIGRAWWTCAVVLLAVLVLRPVWGTSHHLPPAPVPADQTIGPGARLAGTRRCLVGRNAWRGGTLAAAVVLPQDIPHRQVLVLAALAVVAEPGAAGIQPALAGAQAGTAASGPRGGRADPGLDAPADRGSRIGRLRTAAVPEDPPEVLAMLQRRTEERSLAAWERLGRPENEIRTAATAMRSCAWPCWTPNGQASNFAERVPTLPRWWMRCWSGWTSKNRCSTPRWTTAAPATGRSGRTAGGGGRLRSPGPGHRTGRFRSTPQCHDCLTEGTTPVHLRLCLECGNVGCYDSSRPARGPAPQHHGTPSHAQRRAGGDMALVLCRRSPAAEPTAKRSSSSSWLGQACRSDSGTQTIELGAPPAEAKPHLCGADLPQCWTVLLHHSDEVACAYPNEGITRAFAKPRTVSRRYGAGVTATPRLLLPLTICLSQSSYRNQLKDRANRGGP